MAIQPPPDEPHPLVAQAEAFAEDLTATLTGALPQAPGAIAEVAEGGRVLVHPTEHVPLFVQQERLASLMVSMRCKLDAAETFLAVETSSVALVAMIDRTPLARFEYVRDPHWVPSAHLQIHAHRGALTHLLSRSGHDKPHEMASLHFPVGGARFRPCVEDVIQFLIADCRFDSRDGWETLLDQGRERWRRIQAHSVVRDFPEEAAETLQTLGYTVAPPPEGHPETPVKAKWNW